MARTKTDIANLALISLGLGTVSDIDQPDNVPAEILQSVYDQCRRTVLVAGNWSFALKTNPFVYDKQKDGYQIPHDCVRIAGAMTRGVPDPSFKPQMFNGVIKFPFNSFSLSGSELLYIYDTHNVGEYSNGFVLSLRDCLAMTICVSATGNQNQKLLLEQSYKINLSEALLNECLQFPIVSRRDSMTPNGYSYYA